MKRKVDYPQLTYSALALLSLVFLKTAEVKPNRIAPGETRTLYELVGWPMMGFVMGFLVLALFSINYNGKKATLSGMLAPLLFTALLLLLGRASVELAQDQASVRLTFSAGFYMTLLMVYLLLGHAVSRRGVKRAPIYGALALSVAAAGLFLFQGQFEVFSIMKEFANKREQFFTSLSTHLVLSLGSVAAGAFLAIPLGYLAYRKKKLESLVMVPLSIVETIPSLSLFGVLLVPLAALGRLSFFRSLGVSGIGWAPAFVALTLYTLLPIGRNTLVGFSTVDEAVVEAARGMGMNRGEIFRRILFPLALPIILTGLRIAMVQTLGGAVLAGLVGGGGLGSFVFLGLAEGSPDLVLLGVIPIVVMTLVLDSALKALVKRLRREDT